MCTTRGLSSPSCVGLDEIGGFAILTPPDSGRWRCEATERVVLNTAPSEPYTLHPADGNQTLNRPPLALATASNCGTAAPH
jgi:hypothetical protein